MPRAWWKCLLLAFSIELIPALAANFHPARPFYGWAFVCFLYYAFPSVFLLLPLSPLFEWGRSSSWLDVIAIAILAIGPLSIIALSARFARRTPMLIVAGCEALVAGLQVCFGYWFVHGMGV